MESNNKVMVHVSLFNLVFILLCYNRDVIFPHGVDVVILGGGGPCVSSSGKQHRSAREITLC